MSEAIANYINVESLVFAGFCTITALFAILLDWCLLMLKNRSILKISYGSKNRWVILALWSLASGAVGLFAGMLSVVQQNLQGAVAVAVGWPVLFTRVFDPKVAGEVQQHTEEEEEDENEAL